jgi:hypothetical protein
MSAKAGPIALAVVALIMLIAAAPAQAITIVSPASGVTLRPGQTLTVSVVRSSPTEQVSSVAIGLGDDPVDATASASVPGQFDAVITVPVTWVGPHFIIAVAILEGGSGAIDYLEVNIDPGPLQTLIVSAPARMSAIGQVVQLVVQGTFADGVVRFVALPERGTTYASSNDAVLGVHPDGLIQARTNGFAEIRATNRGKTATAVVNVSVPDPPNNHIPVADPGPDRAVLPRTAVTLSAAASSDSDGDPLTYHWEQESGRIVTMVDAETVEATFVSPQVDSREVLVFSLVVTDSKGATTFPTLVTITVTP